MTKLKLTVFSAFAALTAASALAIAPLENLLELSPSEVRLPAHEADQVRVKQCADCEPLRLQVNADTVYRVGGFSAPAIPLNDFRTELRKFNRADDIIIYVGYIHDTFEVERIVVSAGAQ